ncbi:MAG: hypothetical protein U0401_04555 [Anaerolineae bacterium]
MEGRVRFGVLGSCRGGDTVVVGAPGDDIGANSDQGSAYVFVTAAAGIIWLRRPS